MNRDGIRKKITDLLNQEDTISLGILYGSLANHTAGRESDLDLGVAGTVLLDKDQKINLVEKLALLTGRPVDLVDLQETHGTLLHQILTTGELLYCSDTSLYAEIMKRMLFNQADMMPYYYRILKERRETWINE